MGLEIIITNGIKKGINEMIRTFVKDMTNEMLVDNFLTDEVREAVQGYIWAGNEMDIHDLMRDASGIDWTIGGRGEQVTIDDINKAIVWMNNHKDVVDIWNDGKTYEKAIKSLHNISNNMWIVEDEINLDRMQTRQEELLQLFEGIIFNELHNLYYQMYNEDDIEDCFLNNFDNFVDTIAIDRWESGETEMVYAF